VSLVFPRNQVAFLSVIRSYDIRMWRGNEVGWYHDCNDIGRNHLRARALRLADAVSPWVRHARPVEGDMVRASLFLRTNLPKPAWALHCARIRQELDALQAPEVFHLWWHDHNFGPQLEQRLARVEQVLDMIAERCDRGLLVSRAMGDFRNGASG